MGERTKCVATNLDGWGYWYGATEWVLIDTLRAKR